MHHAGYVSTEVLVCFFAMCACSWVCPCQIQTDIKTITMTIGAAKLNYEKVSACVACPLCNKFFRNATTISECCHSCKCFVFSSTLCFVQFCDLLFNTSFADKTNFLGLGCCCRSSWFLRSLIFPSFFSPFYVFGNHNALSLCFMACLSSDFIEILC